MSEAEVRWLAPHEQWGWRAYLRGGRLLDQALDHDLQAHGAQLSEYEILAMLSESDGHLRMSALADLIVTSRSRLTHTATRLEKRGWVERRPVHEDRRGVELWLTDDGLAALRRLAPVHVQSVRTHLLAHLDEQQFVQFAEAMNAIRLGILGIGAHEAQEEIR
ncbi:MarR family winged helix-turn-helix transcriptional regulator [Gephyromycinifex aptenodytis]|uniref:MarR family winged helix-turn-helix transcriptional regulator n=1 Tax=Gephyromycinifex aptenodytis TaxID=2716227 RepID=UPI001447649C|nr:MarR family transcriptional regulator [Gephyromycinifex aptenodytis]